MRRPQNWKKSPTCFDKTAVFTQLCQNKWEIFSNFCGLLKKVELYMGPNDGTNGSFPPSFQEHGVAPSSGALRRRALCFAKWSNCFLTRLALKQKCKSVPNHVQPAEFWHLMTQILSKGHNPFKHKSYKSIFKRNSSASLLKIWWNRFTKKKGESINVLMIKHHIWYDLG